MSSRNTLGTRRPTVKAPSWTSRRQAGIDARAVGNKDAVEFSPVLANCGEAARRLDLQSSLPVFVFDPAGPSVRLLRKPTTEPAAPTSTSPSSPLSR